MRKARAKKRPLLPDPKFHDILVTRFVNSLMYQGKKSTAYILFYDAIEIVQKKADADGLETWKKALTNVTPNVEVRSRRVGGATFQIPQEIRPERRSLIEDHRRNRRVFRFFADEINDTGNRAATVKRRRRSFDYLHLFEIERQYVQKTNTAGKSAERWKTIL